MPLTEQATNIPELECFALNHAGSDPNPMVPAPAERDWMDATNQHFAYRCTPLNIANASGWEILNPSAFSATWTGGNKTDDIIIRTADGSPPPHQVGHFFGHGILTFHPGYLFRTTPGWMVWARGSPNRIKDGIQPLEGMIETSWLPFTFTMNWKFTRPGTVHFAKNEPFCFVTLVPATSIETVQPVLKLLSDDPNLEKEYNIWTSERSKFNSALKQGDVVTNSLKWQKDYLNGKAPGKGKAVAHEDHRVKRSLKPLMMQPKLKYIASYPKSGNTWVRLVLTCAAQLKEEPRQESFDFNSIEQSTGDFLQMRRLSEVAGIPIDAFKEENIEPAKLKLQAVFNLSKNPWWMLRSHSPKISAIIDHSLIKRAIYVIRDPRDVAVSMCYYTHNEISPSKLDETIAFMARPDGRFVSSFSRAHEVLQSWSLNVASWTTPNSKADMDWFKNHVKVFRYEDMLAEPKKVFSTIIEHMELDVPTAIVEKAVQLCSFELLQEAEQTTKFATAREGPFFRTGQSGYWKEILSPAQAERIVADHGAQMRRFGYLE